VQSTGSVDQVLAAHRDMRDGAGDASSASSRCSTPDMLPQSPKPTVPPHRDPPPIPVPSPSTEVVTLREKLPEVVTLREKLPVAGECCIGPTCEGRSVSKVFCIVKIIPLTLQLNAQCDLKRTGI
jgi:hypothetical protein